MRKIFWRCCTFQAVWGLGAACAFVVVQNWQINPVFALSWSVFFLLFFLVQSHPLQLPMTPLARMRQPVAHNWQADRPGFTEMVFPLSATVS